jgi:hypothetical protein
MSSLQENRESETLLVYLPCYVDYEMALAQAIRIRELEKSKFIDMNLKVEIVISCNGADLSLEDISKIRENSDYTNIFPFGISGDINITQGFMHAITLNADYLWILSSNDEISDHFLETIQVGLIQQRDANILVGCTSENYGIREINSVFDPANRDIPFGLISSVIYRTKAMANNFDSAVQLNWTGWGQLAAIEASCIALDGLSVSLVAESALYRRSSRTLEDPFEEKIRIRNSYTHSFFGLPIIISILHAAQPEKKRKYLNGWIWTNWYLVNYFLGTNFRLRNSHIQSSRWNSHLASDQLWVRRIAFEALSNASICHRLVLGISKRINFNALSDFGWAQKLQMKVQKRS